MCRVCGRKNLKKKFRAKGWGLYRCGNCGFVFVNRKPTELELQKIYGFTYFNHSKYKDKNALRLENERRMKLLLKYSDVGERIIDVGCAGGEFLSLAKEKFDVYGMDYSSEAIIRAKKRLPDLENRLFIGDSEEFSIDKSFEVAVFWDVIEHVWGPIEVVQNISKLIRKKGYLIISTPNIGASFAKLTGKFWPFMTPPEHLSFLTKKSFDYLAERCGFEVVDWSSKGKRVNIVFLFYKIGRIFPKLINEKLINLLSKTFLKDVSVYIPTGDIQYVVLKKKK